MIVSNTLVTAHNTCKRRAYYMNIMGVEPILLPIPLYRGIVGHEAWGSYYDNGRDIEAAHEVIAYHISDLLQKEPDALGHIAALTDLNRLIKQYHAFYQGDNFEILAVEEKFTTQINDSLQYAMRLDLLIRYTSGPFRGDIAVMDHKFVYNFKTLTEIKLDAQLPKYVKTLGDNGYVVTKGVFNQIRHRDMKDPPPEKLFRREIIQTNPVETETIWEEQKEAALEIYNWDGRPPRRTLNPLVCKSCPFDRLCKKEMSGESIDNMIKFEFRPSTYGYAEEE